MFEKTLSHLLQIHFICIFAILRITQYKLLLKVSLLKTANFLCNEMISNRLTPLAWARLSVAWYGSTSKADLLGFTPFLFPARSNF